MKWPTVGGEELPTGLKVSTSPVEFWQDLLGFRWQRFNTQPSHAGHENADVRVLVGERRGFVRLHQDVDVVGNSSPCGPDCTEVGVRLRLLDPAFGRESR